MDLPPHDSVKLRGFRELKRKVRQAQVKAAVQVNTALLTFYWDLGADIVERQKTAQWGSGFLKQLSADLMAEFPDVKGFSEANIRFVRRWYLFYSEAFSNSVTSCDRIGQQPVAQLVQIPWGHNPALQIARPSCGRVCLERYP